ncbi:ATP-binding protein [Cryomorpha ignava]|uniref:ATP-binding protein n=1 Tax=Cryomorpha ignava TaxID=101383 RepID=A0A7K3WRB1_9FLAO|nr:ATP-binding protein [Cryomorpha ignava]
MHNLYASNRAHAKRILAHRQTWFTSNSMDLTAAKKKQTETNINNQDQQITSRWQDVYSSQRSSISIFDLINSQNIRARHIAKAVDEDDMDSAKKLSNAQAPIEGINELLAIANIPIEISLGKDEQLFASKNGSALYSIAELSDGERNALLIAADVLTSDPNTLIIIDEPESHLHRAIISPLLTSLFLKRSDCAFVISIHDIFLPVDNFKSSTLLVRNCSWNGKNIDSWDADLIAESAQISPEIKKSILGAKREILFVEGNNESLDRQIYQLIYPTVSVVPKGSCKDVESCRRHN